MIKKFLLAMILIGAFFCSASFAGTIPEPTGYVVDTLGLLKQETVTTLTAQCKSMEPKGQMAILIINSTQPMSVEEYSIKVWDKWKVGFKGKDNGVILILAKNDRKIRIQTGRGTEAIIPDFIAGRIIDNIIAPCFKKGDWDGGMLQGTDAIKKEMLK